MQVTGAAPFWPAESFLQNFFCLSPTNSPEHLRVEKVDDATNGLPLTNHVVTWRLNQCDDSDNPAICMKHNNMIRRHSTGFFSGDRNNGTKCQLKHWQSAHFGLHSRWIETKLSCRWLSPLLLCWLLLLLVHGLGDWTANVGRHVLSERQMPWEMHDWPRQPTKLLLTARCRPPRRQVGSRGLARFFHRLIGGIESKRWMAENEPCAVQTLNGGLTY